MSRKLRQGTIFLVLISVILLLFGGYYYLVNMNRTLWNQLVSETLEITSQGAYAFDIYIEKDKEMLNNLMENISQYNSWDSDAILNKLEMFENEKADYTVINLDRGIMYSNRIGKGRRLTGEELQVYESFSEEGIREPYLDEYTGQRTLGYYKSFLFKNGTRGIVQKGRLVSELSDEFSLSFYQNTGFSYIVNGQGDILIRSKHKNSNHTFSNIFDVITINGNDIEDVDEFKEKLSNHEKGVMRFHFSGEEYIFAFTAINSIQDWYLISIIPNAVVIEYANQVLGTSRSLVFLVVMVLVIVLLFVLANRHYHIDMKKKELEVQYREQVFRILAENMNDVFLMLSETGRTVEYVSPNVERVLGIPAQKVKQDITALGRDVYNDGIKMSYSDLQAIEVGGCVVYERERIHKKTKEHKRLMETVYRIQMDHTEKFIVILSDRTMERQSEYALKEALESAQAANASKSIFLSNMSHDIRTPMNAIIGLSTLLQRDAYNPEKVLEHTRKIMASSQHLLGLINDVLDMSKIESGKVTLNISEINLAEILEEIGTIMRPQARAKRQDFEVSVFDVQTEHLLGDKLRINQILINILSNAVKYTPVGGRIEMEIRQMPQITNNYAHLRFCIRDSGTGMSQEYLKTIFQPFTREISSTTNKIQGTGLGMAITKNLVDLMGGIIKVESKPGEGSTFTVDLELRIQEWDEDHSFWKNHGISNILVIDDETEVCANIQRAMAKTGVTVQAAENGVSAVEMVEAAYRENHGFDLILMDWKMPGFDGIETARRIRSMISIDIPIMLLSAYDWSEIEEEGAEAGIDGFLAKPFFLSNFKLAIEKLDRTVPKQEEKQQEKDALEGKHILAAEDNELNAEILADLLDMHGASCEIAKDGKEALKMFEQSEPGKYDLILMDVQMPVMNGYEATRAIRACSHQNAKSIPIIAMTANAFADDIRDALNAGMNAHVAKPVDMDKLQVVIREI